MKEKTCFITGYRPQKLSWGFVETNEKCKRLKKRLSEEIERAIKDGYIHFISGMALGVDMWAAEAIIRLKHKYTHITLEAAIPFEMQAARWNSEQHERYYRILENCDKVTLLSYRYTVECYKNRNQYMIEKSALLIAVFNGKMGGTCHTFNRSKQKGLRIVLIDPEA